MSQSVSFSSIMGFSAQDHALGSEIKEAGATVSGSVCTIDTTKACRLRPRGVQGANPSAPGGYKIPALFHEFKLSNASGTVGATQTVFQTSNAVFKMTMDATTGLWTFILNAITLGTYQPTTTHHVYMIANKAVSGGEWVAGDNVQVSVAIDRIMIIDTFITASAAQTSGGGIIQPEFGASAGVATGGNTATYQVSHYCGGWTDRANNIGKVTVKEWTPRLGITPPTGYDQANKSTGTDAAALIDERPPTGSGTTDTDYYQCLFNGTNQKQVFALATSLLGTGDTLYAVIGKYWGRAIGASKSNSENPIMHDGTNVVTGGGSVSVAAPSSYAEVDYTGSGTGGWIFTTAPDGAAWPTKTNTYLDGCFMGTNQSGITANADGNYDAVVAEGAIVVSGEEIDLTPQRNLFVMQAVKRGAYW